MLSRIQRVSNRQFEEVMKKGRIVHSPLFLARTMEVGTDTATRIAAVMPVKIGKTAVIRNRSRRVIYASARSLLGDLKKGSIIVLVAKAPLLKATSAEVLVGVKEIFVKAGLMR